MEHGPEKCLLGQWKYGIPGLEKHPLFRQKSNRLNGLFLKGLWMRCKEEPPSLAGEPSINLYKALKIVKTVQNFRHLGNEKGTVSFSDGPRSGNQ